MRKILADPAHIANTIKLIFELPIEINVEEITIRPPVHIAI